MKSLALFTIALLLPITAKAQDQSEEISRLKSELKAAEEEKAEYKRVVEKFAKEMTDLLGANVTLAEIPAYFERLARRANEQGAELDELTVLTKFHQERHENLLKEKQEPDTAVKKLKADLGKALQLEEEVPLEKAPMIVAELADKNKQLGHQSEEMKATIESLQAELEKLKKK
jgi:predicted RNase H-like nuclease (RuvC/YqgF family)